MLHLEPRFKSSDLAMDEATLTISEVAAEVGIRASAIRYYERIGVLPEPERSAGQRRYTDETLGRLRAIEIGKRAGFSLDEIRTLLTTEDQAAAFGEQLRELAERKLPEVDALIEQAQTMRRWLATASACSCETIDVCLLFEPTAVAAGRPRSARHGAPTGS